MYTFVTCSCFLQQTLRRMCYLTIKEMANISEDVIIVTSRFVILFIMIFASPLHYVCYCFSTFLEYLEDKN